MKKILLCTIPLIIAGCVSPAQVPQTDIRVKLPGAAGDLRLQSPKEMDIANFRSSVDGAKVTVSFDRLSSHNSPDVIAAVTAQNAAIAAQNSAMADKVLQFGSKALEMGAAAAMKGVVP